MFLQIKWPVDEEKSLKGELCKSWLPDEFILQTNRTQRISRWLLLTVVAITCLADLLWEQLVFLWVIRSNNMFSVKRTACLLKSLQHKCVFDITSKLTFLFKAAVKNVCMLLFCYWGGTVCLLTFRAVTLKKHLEASSAFSHFKFNFSHKRIPQFAKREMTKWITWAAEQWQ